MRCVGAGTAGVVAISLGVSGVAAAHPASSETRLPRFLFFSGTDLWRHGSSTYGGLMWSPGGVDRAGFTLKIAAGGGLYRYESGRIPVTGRQLTAAILPGWRFVRERLTVAVMAGPDIQSHQLLPDDPQAGLRGRHGGLRAGFELWHEPTPATMLAADASVSTIGPGYSARAAFGWRVRERFYLGPEVRTFAAKDNYRQVRAGVHLTGLRSGSFEWSAGLGWSRDTDRRIGAYGALGLVTRR